MKARPAPSVAQRRARFVLVMAISFAGFREA
jgi:hypothetical protein